MRGSSLHLSSLVLGLGLALACSPTSPEAEPDASIEAQQPATAPETSSPTALATDEPHAPTVAAPAPALALDSLSGTRVQLPVANAERATVLVFGSFS